jgi:hypothetical protein
VLVKVGVGVGVCQEIEIYYHIESLFPKPSGQSPRRRCLTPLVPLLVPLVT